MTRERRTLWDVISQLHFQEGEVMAYGSAGPGPICRIFICSVAVPIPYRFVALRPTLKVPLAPGIPEINPVVVLTRSPKGSPEAPKLVGLFVAVIWYPKSLP